MVSRECPILGATLNAQVFDFACVDYFRIAEVKCLYTKYHVTPLDACTDAKFFMEQISASECKLKEKPPVLCPSPRTYGSCGSKVVWHYCFYQQRNLCPTHTFDPVFRAVLEQKLPSYYFEHFIKFASAKLFYWKCLEVWLQSTDKNTINFIFFRE